MVERKDNQDIDLLGKKLKSARKRQADDVPDIVDNAAMGIAMKIGIELAVSIAVVTYLGYLLDQWLDIAPAGLIVGVLLGFAVGLRNVFREAAKMQGPVETEDDKNFERED